MSQISKKVLDKDTEARIFAIFQKSLADLRNSAKVGAFLNSLLTPTEKVMLVKRLAIAVLLTKGYDYRTICNVLKVSSTTVGRMAFNLECFGEGLRPVIKKIIEDKKAREYFLELKEGFGPVFVGHPASKKRVAAEYRSEREKEEASFL